MRCRGCVVDDFMVCFDALVAELLISLCVCDALLEVGVVLLMISWCFWWLNC